MSTSQTTTEGAKCSVCQKNKFQLRSRKSRLNGQPMLVCNTCFDNKFEPRWLIIIMAQDKGIEAVQDYLVKKLYIGKTIEAVDLVK